MKVLRVFCRQISLVLLLGAGLILTSAVAQAQTPQPPIAAVRAFDTPNPCSEVQLGGVNINLLGHFLTHVPSPWRGNPEWKAIIVDPNKPSNLQPPTILEGFVTPQPVDQKSSDQSSSEVAEEDLWWTHNTHDFTFKVIPDSAYSHLLSSWVNPDGTTGVHTDMEVEWDNASLMDEHEGFQRIWGGVPEFAWPAVSDRVWVAGRWIFDCGHPSSSDVPHVQFSTEIHPPRALVAFRLMHPALDSFPRDRVSEPNHPGLQSYLPVTGEPQAGEGFPTAVPLTEADIYVSGNGAAANDLCSITAYPCAGHTSPFIPVNDRNYVFDIYPPGTCYGPAAFCNPPDNGTFKVSPPVPDASLQWRIVDHSGELPTHACGGNNSTACATVDPIICLLDESTPLPNQSETGCPAVPAHPTRLRVILPFNGTNANFFAKSILLGWDDVPAPANNTAGVRTFRVRLHSITVKDNGAGCCNDADWRVFLNVGGQYRYMSPFFDTDAAGGHGIKAFDGGDNVCEGDALTENGNDDCFRFDNTPWTVSVQDGTPIHVAVGGFVARGLEDPNSDIRLCHPTNYFGGCNSPTTDDFNDATTEPFEDLALDNDDRIGTYEFDLLGPDYSPPAPFTTAQFGCSVFSLTGCSLRYAVDFRVQEVASATAPASDPIQIGDPHYNNFVTSATPITLSSSDPSAQGFQYRFHLQGGALPIYSSSRPFPVHWTNANFSNGHTVPVYLNGASAKGDGAYDFQYSANSVADLLEPRQTQTVNLDNTPPVITIKQPADNGQYTHADTLTIDYSVSDGTGSGEKSDTPKMDGSTTLTGGTVVANHLKISLFSQMTLGTHTFSVDAVDNVNNAATKSATFSIIVTPDSLKSEVNIFVALGCIDNSGIGNSLTSKLNDVKARLAAGDMHTAINTLTAFLNQLRAQAGKHISTICTDPNSNTQFDPLQVLTSDTEYLLAGLKTTGVTDPIFGYVVNGNNGVSSAAITLFDAGNVVVATTTSDATGFYFFAQANALTVGANYTLRVTTIPRPFTASTPASQTFTWSAAQVSLNNFALN